jgi:diguanylate cyclase (GGDEF)-like protein
MVDDLFATWRKPGAEIRDTGSATGAVATVTVKSDIRPELLRSLGPFLAGASALLLAFGLYDGRGEDWWPAVCVLAALHLAGSAVVKYLTRNSRKQVLLRSTQGLWHWLTSAAILFAAGGFPSPFWLLFLFGAIVSGMMCDRTGGFVNFLVAGAALAGPHLAAGINLSMAANIGMLLLILASVSVVTEVSARRLFEERAKHARAEEELRYANARLNVSVAQMERHDKDSRLLTELGRMLQTATSMQEMDEVIGAYLQRLFPTECGALFVYSPSRDDLEAKVTWGGFPEERSERAIAPDDCRALRRGGVYAQNVDDADIACPHVGSNNWSNVICIPLIAHGDVLGLFHLRIPDRGADAPADDPERETGLVSSLAVSVSEYIALALANQQLRETMRNQAIRDSLTGLFNRRFAEETLNREIQRAVRHGLSVSVVFADIDHFKVVNDTYGHDAGDLILQRIGSFLQTQIRGHDVACRFGGEEFLIVLTDAPLDGAQKRADALREGIQAMQIVHSGRTIGVTASFGVAALPDNGESAGSLMRAADAALYRAKDSGRNCVVAAGRHTPDLKKAAG